MSIVVLIINNKLHGYGFLLAMYPVNICQFFRAYFWWVLWLTCSNFFFNFF